MRGVPKNFREERLFINKEEGTYIQVRRVKTSLNSIDWYEKSSTIHWTVSKCGIIIDSYFTKERAMKAARKLRREVKNK